MMIMEDNFPYGNNRPDRSIKLSRARRKQIEKEPDLRSLTGKPRQQPGSNYTPPKKKKQRK